MCEAELRAELALERVQVRTYRGNPVCPKRLLDKSELGLTHVRRRKKQARLGWSLYDHGMN
jgi:hypothetical protein